MAAKKNAKATKKAVGVVLPTWLNVRVEPNGEIIDKIPKGTAVEIVVNESGWANVHVDGLSGWVASEFLAVGRG